MSSRFKQIGLSKRSARHLRDFMKTRLSQRGLALLTVFAILRVAGCRLVLAATSPEKTAPLPNVGSTYENIVQAIVAFVIVIVLILVVIRFLARRANITQRGDIRVVAARQLAPNRSVQVVDVHGRKFLLGVGNDITLLADVTDEMGDSMTNPEVELGFASSLSSAVEQIRKKYRTEGDSADKS